MLCGEAMFITSKKLMEKSLEKKLHNMGTEELIQICSQPMNTGG